MNVLVSWNMQTGINSALDKLPGYKIRLNNAVVNSQRAPSSDHIFVSRNNNGNIADAYSTERGWARATSALHVTRSCALRMTIFVVTWTHFSFHIGNNLPLRAARDLAWTVLSVWPCLRCTGESFCSLASCALLRVNLFVLTIHIDPVVILQFLIAVKFALSVAPQNVRVLTMNFWNNPKSQLLNCRQSHLTYLPLTYISCSYDRCNGFSILARIRFWEIQTETQETGEEILVQ